MLFSDPKKCKHPSFPPLPPCASFSWLLHGTEHNQESAGGARLQLVQINAASLIQSDRASDTSPPASTTRSWGLQALQRRRLHGRTLPSLSISHPSPCDAHPGAPVAASLVQCSQPPQGQGLVGQRERQRWHPALAEAQHPVPKAERDLGPKEPGENHGEGCVHPSTAVLFPCPSACLLSPWASQC